MKTLQILVSSTSSAAFVCWYANLPINEAFGVSTAVGAITATIWWAGRAIAMIRSPLMQDVHWLANGDCPVCHTGGSMTEVSSTGTSGYDRQTMCRCNACGERFDIRTSDEGPIVLRLGKVPGAPT